MFSPQQHHPSRRWTATIALVVMAGLLLMLAISLSVRFDRRADAASPQSTAGVKVVAVSNPTAQPQVDFTGRIRPVLEQFCFKCHNEHKHKGHLILSKFTAMPGVLKQRKVWRKIADKLDAHDMPPDDEKQPSEAQRSLIVHWVRNTVDVCNCDGPLDPGRETIRRLNRDEYNNTIRDLVGLDLRPADKFPVDDVGEGFDNMGDVLSLPPLLMEKYLDAAQHVLDAAIVTQRVPEPEKRHFQAATMKVEGGGRADGSLVVLFSNGNVHKSVKLPAAARYTIRARAWAEQAGDEPAKMALLIDDSTLKVFDIVKPRNHGVVYEVPVDLSAGSHTVAAAFINDFYDPHNPDPNRRDRNLFVNWVEVNGPTGVKPAPLTASHRRIFIADPIAGHERDAAATIVSHFAERAFRRPVADDEVQRYLTLYDAARKQDRSFVEGVKQSLLGVLVSPHFLFRVERDRPSDQPFGAYPVDDYELASRLSYFIWASMPDDELFTLAQQHKLHEPAVIEQQVRRMLRDPKARALIDDFAEQWLELRNLAASQPDPKLFPEYDPALRKDMMQEVRYFLASVMLEDRSILDLLDANYTFVNERLAKLYGIPGIKGDQMRRVELPDHRRGGVLTMAAVLTVTSNPNRTNPVLRGKWVLQALLGTPPPPPPANVPALEATHPHDASLTLRKRMEMHRADPICASCHKRMDPLGFALENFDAIGRWRDRDAGLPIDASGVLPDGRHFDGPVQLKAMLLHNRDQFVHAFTQKMLIYALGRPLDDDDECAVRTITTKLAADDYRFSTLVAQVAMSRPFRYRRPAMPHADSDADAAAHPDSDQETTR